MSVDFTLIHAAIDKLGTRLRREVDPEALARTLAERARALATRHAVVEQRQVFALVLAARRGPSLLGFPMDSVEEARRVTVVPLPHATSFVQGVFQVRGEVLTLLDCQPFFGVAEALPSDRVTMAVLVAHRGERFGVRVDEVIGPRLVFADERDEAMQERAHPFVQAVTRDLMTVIGVGELLERPEMVVEEKL